MSNVGARTAGSASPARSGLPPRETTAPTSSGRSAAAMREQDDPRSATWYAERAFEVEMFERYVDRLLQIIVSVGKHRRLHLITQRVRAREGHALRRPWSDRSPHTRGRQRRMAPES